MGPTKKANGTDQDQERNSVVVRISTTLRYLSGINVPIYSTTKVP